MPAYYNGVGTLPSDGICRVSLPYGSVIALVGGIVGEVNDSFGAELCQEGMHEQGGDIDHL
ncbi:hypothetical protein GCM10023333_08840 [Ferrimonas pelagia]|uniref:Uncharacterized protein n=1 Tax=Ferrimonas pelagia TaxID=1177826 RepID=A0ABP9EFD4_9GAMM